MKKVRVVWMAIAVVIGEMVAGVAMFALMFWLFLTVMAAGHPIEYLQLDVDFDAPVSAGSIIRTRTEVVKYLKENHPEIEVQRAAIEIEGDLEFSGWWGTMTAENGQQYAISGNGNGMVEIELVGE